MDPRVKCYCISLKENKCGRIYCQSEFDRVGLNVEFEIVERSEKGGTHGCFTSHIKCLRKGLESNAEYIMVMEEDVYFEYSDPEIFQKISRFLGTRSQDIRWCLTLGYLTASQSRPVNYDIIALERCYSGHAYIVPRHTAEKLIEMEWKEIPYDVHWHKVIQIFYAPYPMIAFQREHGSSISTVSDDFVRYMIHTIGYKNIARLCEFLSSFPI